MPRAIRISLQEGTVYCTPDMGNIWAPEGDVQWICGTNVTSFRLRFRKAAAQGNGATSDWPFANPPPAESPNSTGRVPNFTGTVKGESGVYEYGIEVNPASVSDEAPTAYLDPMIIVGRG